MIGRPEPMLAYTADEPFDREGWIFEVKWDGYRCLARKQGNSIELISRNGELLNGIFPLVVNELIKFPGNFIMDGEIVALDEKGKPSFQILQKYGGEQTGALRYFVFDLLSENRKDLRGLPLLERKRRLEGLIPASDIVKFSPHVEKSGNSFFKQIEQQGLEGMIAKRADSAYMSGRRSKDWLKIKTSHRQEAVVIGFTGPKHGRSYFGALLLGVYEKGELVYAGRVGTGFTFSMLNTIFTELKSIEQKNSPLRDPPKSRERLHWVKPVLVCEVGFREWTDDGQMRHPSFLGWRRGKKAVEVTREAEVEITQNDDSRKIRAGMFDVEISHWNKIFWPSEGYTKGDLVSYYRSIAHFILPHLRDRPQSLNRFPHGIEGGSFYQKDVPDAPEWVRLFPFRSEGENREIQYVICNDEATLLYLIQLGCIELNVWNARMQTWDFPDYLVMDLDPEDIPFEAVIETALEVKRFFDRLKAPTFCKTSGATGLHIYMPLNAKYTHEQVRRFAEISAQLINRRLPDITSVERLPSQRQKRVYLDFLQNRRGQTMASPYSVRPRPGAPVSMPLEWNEVKIGLDPSRFTLKNARDRILRKGDLWKPVLGKGIKLEKCLAQLQLME